MSHIFSAVNGLVRSLSTMRRGTRNTETSSIGEGKEEAEGFAKEAKQAKLMSKSSRDFLAERSDCFVSMFSKGGEKGSNQDCFLVWEEFGFQEDMIFCGLFDGHGPWGHFVSKSVRDSLAPSLLCSWQHSIALVDLETEKRVSQFDIWKQSFIRSCAAVDQELRQSRRLDSFHSGTTALSVIKQDDLMVVANVGDSRAVIVTTSDDGELIPVQLTIDSKPNLPQEAERITGCKGLVFCLPDEPGVHRIWLPDGEKPGLAMSRAFGDYCVKDYGLISVPEITDHRITGRDLFLILATDGVWDVISNQEAARIVFGVGRGEREKSAKRLVESAARAWKKKRKGVAVDDCSAIILFFGASPPPRPE